MLKLIKNRFFIRVFLFIIILLSIAFILNLKVSYYQGINYEVRQKRTPFYLKIIDFLSRHYHYKELLKEIIKQCKTDDEKIYCIFEWAHENIKKVPEGFSLIDDHVYNIIIRGYGTDDQSADVFATLCAYAGFAAKWLKIYPRDSRLWIAVAVVNNKNRWLIFDPSRGNYFTNKKEEIASIDDIINDRSIILKAKNKPIIYGLEYVRYFENLSSIQETGILKTQIQMIIPRFIWEIKKLLRIS